MTSILRSFALTFRPLHKRTVKRDCDYHKYVFQVSLGECCLPDWSPSHALFQVRCGASRLAET
jgi:hypothetical protein